MMFSYGAQEVAIGLLSDHPRHCVRSAVRRSDSECDETFAEVTGTIRQVFWL
jgi:hypothetical protein